MKMFFPYLFNVPVIDISLFCFLVYSYYLNILLSKDITSQIFLDKFNINGMNRLVIKDMNCVVYVRQL